MDLVTNLFKKPKVELSKIDPLNPEVFPDEIVQVILSYLSVPELLSATLVSKSWNEAIGSSDAFKKKVCIKLHLWVKDTPTPIKKSSRDYENIIMTDFEVDIASLKCCKDKNWRNVTLSLGKVSSQNSFLEIMNYFKSVRNLKILGTNIRKLNTHNRLVLEDLEHLTLSDVTLDLFDLFIAHQPSLKSLSLRFVITDVASPKTVAQAVVEFMNLNLQLRDLEVNFTVTNDLFMRNVAQEVKGSLKTLVIGLSETDQNTQTKIEEFLKSQGGSIENLKLVFHQKFPRRNRNDWGYWRHRNMRRQNNDEDDDEEDDNPDVESSENVMIILNAWNSLTAMKSLNLRFLQNSADLQLKQNPAFIRSLKPNSGVTSIYFQFMGVNILEAAIIAVLGLSPNVQHIYTTKLTPGIVKFAALHLKALRKLDCFGFEGACTECYAELINVESDVNKFIAIRDQCALG